MAVSQEQMMRELHHFAMEESRNRGLEDAVSALLRWRQQHERLQYDISYGQAIEIIRGLKRDPSKHLSDWWAEESNTEPRNYATDRVFDGVRPLSADRVAKLRANYERTADPAAPND